MGNLRLVIVDANELTRALLKYVFYESSVVEIVGEAVDCESAIAMLRNLVPDAVIVGDGFAQAGSASVHSVIRTAFPEVRLIELSTLDKAVLKKTKERCFDRDALDAIVAGSSSDFAR